MPAVSLIDASRIITQSGAEVFVGYPITPTNLVYSYSFERFPVALPAPDEITTLQWMSGFSSVGKFPVTATSFPGYALMLESINMAFMMELPMLIILSQRLGPSTGSATTGAQGDLLLLRSSISGGFPIPVFCPSSFEDAWFLTHKAIETSFKLRCPVVLLTSKEMVMTNKSFDTGELVPLKKLYWTAPDEMEKYQSYYTNGKMVPDFIPLGNNQHQVRINASTHDYTGLIRKTTPAAMQNTKRLYEKVIQQAKDFTFYEFQDSDKHDILLVSYDITAEAVRESFNLLHAKQKNVSYLIVKTLIPVANEISEIVSSFQKVFIIEENLTGLLAELYFGNNIPKNIFRINKIGEMINPQEIVEEILN